MGAGFAITWMPSIVATWVGLGGVVLILDLFDEKAAQRELAPVRRMAGNSLRSALEGTVGFAMIYLVKPPENPVEVAELVKGAPDHRCWRSFETQDFKNARADWRETLQQTETRLGRFLEDYASYLRPREREQVGRLRDYASGAAWRGVWALGESDGARIQVWKTWRDAVSPFCDATKAYEALTGSSLTGRWNDFETFFPLRLPGP